MQAGRLDAFLGEEIGAFTDTFEDGHVARLIGWTNSSQPADLIHLRHVFGHTSGTMREAIRCEV